MLNLPSRSASCLSNQNIRDSITFLRHAKITFHKKDHCTNGDYGVFEDGHGELHRLGYLTHMSSSQLKSCCFVGAFSTIKHCTTSQLIDFKMLIQNYYYYLNMPEAFGHRTIYDHSDNSGKEDVEFLYELFIICLEGYV